MRDGSVGTATAEQQQRAAHKAWGPWLYELGWSHTFDGTIDPRGDHRAKPESVIRGEWRRFHDRLEAMAKRSVPFAYAIEQNAAGRHVHALLYCESLTVRAVRDAWKAGLATAHVYDSSRGAAFYDTKRVGRWDGSESVDVSKEWPPLLHPAPNDTDCTPSPTTEASPTTTPAKPMELLAGSNSRRTAPIRSVDYVAKWTQRLDEWRSLGATVNGEKVAAEVVNDLRALTAEQNTRLLTPAEAAPLTGYHAESIARLVRSGKVTNYGTKHKPRVKLEELPRKGNRSSRRATPVVRSIDSAASSIARDAAASRLGRA